MIINVNLEGLNKILCKLHLHRWFRANYPETGDEVIDYVHPVTKYCLDCMWEVRRK